MYNLLETDPQLTELYNQYLRNTGKNHQAAAVLAAADFLGYILMSFQKPEPEPDLDNFEVKPISPFKLKPLIMNAKYHASLKGDNAVQK